MALLHRRKAFACISRYRSRGRWSFSSSASDKPLSEPAILGIASSPPFSTQMKTMPKLLPAVAMGTSFRQESRSYMTVATHLGAQHSASCCCNQRCTCDCGSPRSGALRILARRCTTTAYPPPAPPQEFQGGDQEAEEDGAPLNVDDPEVAAAMEGAEDFNMPPYDDAAYPEEEEEYKEEDPPPDPEEKLLYSPSDED